MKRIITLVIICGSAGMAFPQNFGIGQSSPAEKLDVNGNIGHTGVMRSQGPNYTSTWMQFDEHVNGNSLILGAGGLTAIGSGESATAIRSNVGASTETLYLSSDNGVNVVTDIQSGWASKVDALTIASNGNVGLGNTAPSERLHLSSTGSVRILLEADTDNSTESDHPQILFVQDGGAVSGVVGYDNSTNNMRIENNWASADADIDFITQSAVRMTVDGNGSVGIGTTGPTATLSVSGTANKTGGGSWATFSDRRVKRDIVPYQDGLAEVLRINPVKFKYIEEFAIPDNKDKEFVGVIAQDMKEIAPYMVDTYLYGREEVYSEDGKESHIVKEGRELYTYDPSALNYMLINAIKEQQKVIETLRMESKTEQAELRAEIEHLKSLIGTLIQEPLLSAVE